MADADAVLDFWFGPQSGASRPEWFQKSERFDGLIRERFGPLHEQADARALRVARAMVERGWDRDLLPVQRQFVYLPFEHAEDLADQDRAMTLFGSLEAYPETRDLVQWAEKHRVIIRRFGRFPHRNAALGRPSTPEELAFLREPGSGF
jgi:uncharacterized protein (DUF924 family)